MDLMLVLIAFGFGGSLFLTEGAAPARMAALPPVMVGTAPGPAKFMAEDQTPTGKFTTAGEVRMILDATKANWVALREYGEQDLIYFTQLLAWRCGLHEIRFAVNGGAEQVFPAEPCYIDTAQPNAIKAETVLPYATAPLGSVQTVTVSLLFDDLGRSSETFSRAAILRP